MFQLIIAVVSIALISALAIASIYYGGTAFNKGSMSSHVTTLVNGGQQIAGAQTLYRTKWGVGSAGTLLSTGTSPLLPEYLSSLPAKPVIVPKTSIWTLGTVSSESVAMIQLEASSALEACKVAAIQGGKPAISSLNDIGTTIPGRFGCYKTGTSPSFNYFFGFKV